MKKVAAEIARRRDPDRWWDPTAAGALYRLCRRDLLATQSCGILGSKRCGILNGCGLLNGRGILNGCGILNGRTVSCCERRQRRRRRLRCLRLRLRPHRLLLLRRLCRRRCFPRGSTTESQRSSRSDRSGRSVRSGRSGISTSRLSPPASFPPTDQEGSHTDPALACR